MNKPRLSIQARARGGHLRYWARYFGISVLPKVNFFTAMQNLENKEH